MGITGIRVDGCSNLERLWGGLKGALFYRPKIWINGKTSKLIFFPVSSEPTAKHVGITLSTKSGVAGRFFFQARRHPNSGWKGCPAQKPANNSSLFPCTGSPHRPSLADFTLGRYVGSAGSLFPNWTAVGPRLSPWGSA